MGPVGSPAQPCHAAGHRSLAQSTDASRTGPGRYGYLDLTGNVSLDLPQPRVRLLLHGAQRDPAPRGRGARGLAGAAGRPAGAASGRRRTAVPGRQLGRTVRAELPYVSRLLGVMEDQGLIERLGRAVGTADWAGLIRKRTAQTNLLCANPSVAMVAPQGQHRVLDRLREEPELGQTVAVTGSAAAGVVAPLTAGGQGEARRSGHPPERPSCTGVVVAVSSCLLHTSAHRALRGGGLGGGSVLQQDRWEVTASGHGRPRFRTVAQTPQVQRRWKHSRSRCPCCLPPVPVRDVLIMPRRLVQSAPRGAGRARQPHRSLGQRRSHGLPPTS